MFDNALFIGFPYATVAIAIAVTAYRFFFEYPRPFPWRLMNFWDDLETWPLEKVLSEEGLAQFGDTFGFLVGKPFTWK